MAEMTALERIKTAIRCEQPDRVPIVPSVMFFAARYNGVPLAKFVEGGDLPRELIMQVFDDFGGWDAAYFSGGVTEVAFALNLPLKLKIPGRDLPPDSLWQFDETSVMSLEEYDDLIKMGWDAFLASRILPRIRPHIPPSEFPKHFEGAAIQGVKDALAWEARGVPNFISPPVSPPFDILSTARSLKEFSVDLYRHPDKVQAALDVITESVTHAAIGASSAMRQATRWGGLTAFLGATREAATFISPKMFEKFAWPYIKRMALALLEAGITPLFHFDSDWTPLLEFFKELPKGTCVLDLDSTTDIFKAKQVLRGHMCLMGDVPPSLLKLGTPEEVTAYVRRLCEEVGEGGGYILGTGCELPVDARPENFRAMLEAGRKYGVYR